MTVRNRLAKLEALNPAREIITIYCVPTNAFNPERPISHKWNEVELAPGVFTSVHVNDGQVRYDSVEHLQAWLKLPEQKNDPDRAYVVLSQAECDKVAAEIEAMC